MTQAILVGCGRHARNTLSKYLCYNTHIEIKYCIDPNVEAAKEAQALLRAESILSELPEKGVDGIELAIIATPPEITYETAKRLLPMRVACFFEKPLAPTSAKISELANIADRYKAYSQIGFNFRFSNAIKALIPFSSEDIRGINQVFIDFRSKHPSGPEWGVENTVEAWLRHNGIHALDIASLLLGEFIDVDTNLFQTSESEFTLLVKTLHRSGSVSILRLGNITEYFDFRIDLTNQRGDHVLMPNLRQVTLLSDKGKLHEGTIYKARNLDDGWGISGYGNELDYFSKHYRSPQEATPSIKDALSASQYCDAIMQDIRKSTLQ